MSYSSLTKSAINTRNTKERVLSIALGGCSEKLCPPQ